MKICKVCKIENEDNFVYCKNCGVQLEITPPVQAPVAPVVPVAPVAPAVPVTPVNNNGVYNPYGRPVAPVAAPVGLVPVEMVLPNPANPEYHCVQTVYVTPAQKAAIQYDIMKNGRKV